VLGCTTTPTMADQQKEESETKRQRNEPRRRQRKI